MAYLVRSIGLYPNSFLTTGIFNLIVKEPNRLPPERRAFSPVRRSHKCESGCPRNLLTVARGLQRVNSHIAQDFQKFSTSGQALNREAVLNPRRADSISLPLWMGRFRRAPERKTAKLRKELLEALALKVPFRTSSGWFNPPEVPNQAPWPGRLEGLKPSLQQMPDKRRELHTIPAKPHTALGELFIPDDSKGVQGGIFGKGMFTGLVREWRAPSPMRGLTFGAGS